MLVDYVLLSTHPEILTLQQEALKQAGCARIILDEAKGTNFTQPGLE
jgi:hypothetical protein